MASLQGTGLGTGIALGTAAVVRLRNGFPLPPAIPPRIMEQLAKRRGEETPDIILVANDYATAVAIADSVRWGNVVGIAAVEGADAPLNETPAVVGVAGLLEAIEEDMLMVVDASRGVVVANPDGVAFAQYQTMRNNMAPKKRLYLDEGHLAAYTLDGRAVQVFAQVTTLDAIETAQANGADALYVPYGSPLLPADADEDEQREALLQLILQAGGKPLLLADEYALPAPLLLEAAVKADLTIACPLMPHLEGLGVGEMGQELNEARADCLANDVLCDVPRFAVNLPLDFIEANAALEDPEQATFFMDRMAYNGAMRVLVSLEYAALEIPLLSSLDAMIRAANTAMLPIYMASWLATFGSLEESGGLDANNQSALEQLVGAGSAALIVPPSDITVVKSAIRELNFWECREALSKLLNDGAEPDDEAADKDVTDKDAADERATA